MRILLVGGGGREHAIAWKLKQSARVSQLFCAPGNAGIASLATCIPIKATDLDALVRFASSEAIDLVFVAPDDPLALGLVDRLEAAGIRAFGPRRNAAVLESSKAFAKDLMRRYRIPTAAYQVFDDAGAALAYVDGAELPLVVKADGLALGKGVVIAHDREEARAAVRDMMLNNRFGQAGLKLVIESCLSGPELTLLAFTDGRTILPMVTSRDHKRACDNDQGLNTGGMGAVAPGADLDEPAWRQLRETILQPTVDAMRAEGRPFKGVLYFGLMLTREGPKVIEYNARFGDPEAQVVLPLLETDLLDIVEAILDERLNQLAIRWKAGAACCVVAASGGYPAAYQTGYPIHGLDQVPSDCLVFHAGTRREDETILTHGGRVLGVTALGPTVGEAVTRAYEALGAISFQDMHFRRDIGRPV
ncbi:MAG: phosphoribosylamine--glycine ligase [Clostridiaceae bacterium]|jgi:phosphoribosylamine--glycine ligase|nr:phosphoribosylamine--glycine ligase [Clostridiaceae bacterium]